MNEIFNKRSKEWDITIIKEQIEVFEGKEVLLEFWKNNVYDITGLSLILITKDFEHLSLDEIKEKWFKLINYQVIGNETTSKTKEFIFINYHFNKLGE